MRKEANKVRKTKRLRGSEDRKKVDKGREGRRVK